MIFLVDTLFEKSLNSIHIQNNVKFLVAQNQKPYK